MHKLYITIYNLNVCFLYVYNIYTKLLLCNKIPVYDKFILLYKFWEIT